MLFRSLTDSELERWVRNSPSDHKAKAEMLRRNTSFKVIEALEAEIAELEDKNDQLQSQLDHYLEH